MKTENININPRIAQVERDLALSKKFSLWGEINSLSSELNELIVDQDLGDYEVNLRSRGKHRGYVGELKYEGKVVYHTQILQDPKRANLMVRAWAVKEAIKHLTK